MSQSGAIGESLAGLSFDSRAVTYDQARRQLQSVRARLSDTIKDYHAACQLIRTIYSATPQSLDTPGREQALLAIDAELSTFSQEESRIRESRDILTDTRNQSKMTAPIYCFPPEILARIFTEATCFCAHIDIYDTVPLISDPIILSSVCRQWRKVAVNHRPLWTHLDLKVSRLGDERQYYDPEIWQGHSQAAPMHVQVRQYRLFDEDEMDYDEDYLSTRDNNQNPAPMVVRLLDFLTPLMRQVTSLSLNLGWPHEYIAAKLMDCWATNGVSGRAEVLKIGSNPDYGLLEISSPIYYIKSFDFLQVLHFYNIAPPWPWSRWTLNKLVDLRLEVSVDENDWLITQLEIASMLTSCPKLQHLALVGLRIRPSRGFTAKLIPLNELQCLEIGCNTTSVLSLVLALINPGESALRLEVSFFYDCKHLQDALGTLQLFSNRSNTTTLELGGCGEQCFASLLGPLPRIQTLVLIGWYFSDVIKVVDTDMDLEDTYVNPFPIYPKVVLWPNLQNLYLDGCMLEKEHLFKIVSLHSIQNLYLRGCYPNRKGITGSQISFQTFQEYAEILSDVVPNISYSEHVPRHY